MGLFVHSSEESQEAVMITELKQTVCCLLISNRFGLISPTTAPPVAPVSHIIKISLSLLQTRPTAPLQTLPVMGAKTPSDRREKHVMKAHGYRDPAALKPDSQLSC